MGAPQKILALSVLVFLMTACGGGSVNTENPAGPDRPPLSQGGALPEAWQAIPEIRFYQPIAPQPRYEGVTTRAELSRQNSFYFVEAVYQLLEAAYEAGTVQLYADKPRILDYDYNSTTDLFCTTGSLDRGLHESDTRLIQVVTFDECESSQHGKAHGQIISEVRLDSDRYPTHAIAAYRDLTFEVEGERLTYHGQITTTTDSDMVVDYLTIYNSALDVTYHTEGLKNRQGAIRGIVYQSDWGYVDVRAEHHSPDDMRLEGSNSSRLHMNLERIHGLAALELTLTSPSIEDQYSVAALNTSVPLDELLLWPYRDNQAPEGELDALNLLEQGQATTLDTSALTDADHDFLTFSWRYLSKPSGCADEVPQNGRSIEFSSECRGLHELELTVGDGFHKTVLPFAVTVAGPFPQIEQSVVVTPEEGSEKLSFQVTLENESEAAPVQYKIVYGPPGIAIDPSGLVTGVPERLFQVQGGSIHIGVEASNERSVVQEITVDYNGRSIEISADNRGGFPRDIARGWQDINGDGNQEQLVDYSNTFAIIEVHQGSTRYRHLETREFSTFSLRDKAVMDFNDDGQWDIVLVYSDKYVVLSGSDFSVLDEQTLEPIPDINRAAVLIPGANPGVYYSLDDAGQEWAFREFKTGQQYRRIAPSLHEVKTADFTGDGQYSLLTTSVQSLGGDPAIVNTDGSVQRLSAYPSAVADINGNGIADIVRLSSHTTADQFTIERYSATTGRLAETYTVNVPELKGEYWFETSFVNLDDEPGDELVMAAYHSDQLYILKRNDSVFEFTQKITYPKRGDQTLTNAIRNLSQFDHNSAVLKGSEEDGQLFRFSLLSNPIEYTSGFGYYSLAPHSANGLRKVQENENSIDFLGVRQWLDEHGENRSELTLNTITSNLDWTAHQRFQQLPPPLALRDVQKITAIDGATEHFLYVHGSNSYSIVDTQTETVLFTGPAVSVAHGVGDLDGDGRVEAYAAHGNELFKLNSDTYDFEVIDDTLQDRVLERMPPFVATFGGATRALFLPWELYPSGRAPRLDIYQYEQGAVRPTGTLRFDIKPRFMGYAQQDVTGNGIPELIVWNTDEQTSFWVIDSSLSVVAQLTSETPVEGVFHLPDHKSDTLIAFKRGQGTGNWRDTRIVQIDLTSGKVITRSPTLPGSPDKYGLTCLGKNLTDCPKMVITDLGIFSLR